MSWVILTPAGLYVGEDGNGSPLFTTIAEVDDAHPQAFPTVKFAVPVVVQLAFMGIEARVVQMTEGP